MSTKEKIDTKGFSGNDLEHRLAAAIGTLMDEDPPSGVTASVMAQLSAKRPGIVWKLRRCFHLHWIAPVLRWIPLGAALALLFFLRLPPPANAPAGRRVTFLLEWPSAASVSVIGSFNRWDPRVHPMHRKTPAGQWSLTLELPEGQHNYAFLIDGVRIAADPNSLWQAQDGFGGCNSTLIVADDKTDEQKL